MYVLNPVECQHIGVKIKQLKVSFPGKLRRSLEIPPNSQYFKVFKRRSRPRSQSQTLVLADLPALISSQHRTAEVQAILSRLNATHLVHMATKNVPATTQQLQATCAQQLPPTARAATSVSQAHAQGVAPVPKQGVAPVPKQAQALQTAPTLQPVQQTVLQHQTQQTARQQGSLPAAFAQQSAKAYEGNDDAAISHISRRLSLQASSSQPKKHVSNCGTV